MKLKIQTLTNTITHTYRHIFIHLYMHITTVTSETKIKKKFYSTSICLKKKKESKTCRERERDTHEEGRD